MKNIIFIFLALVCGRVLSSSIYKDDQPYFSYATDSLQRKSLPMLSDDSTSDHYSWSKHYRRGNQEKRTAPYSLESPEDFQWLVENILGSEGPLKPEFKSTLRKDLAELAMEPIYAGNDNSDNSDGYTGALDFSYAYDIDPAFMKDIPDVDEFEKALREFLEAKNQEKTGDKEETVEPQPKKKVDSESEQPQPFLDPTTTSVPALTELKSTKSETTTDSANNIMNFMPPAASSKGQKEYPMLRPANENRRKFDQWAESFHQTVTNNLHKSQFGATGKNKQEKNKPSMPFSADSLTEQLNKLKRQHHEEVDKDSKPIWF